MKQKLRILSFSALLSSGLIFSYLYVLHYLETRRTVFDLPSQLSGKKETIDVMYVHAASDCADFRTIDSTEGDAAEFIFIEPAQESLRVPDSLYTRPTPFGLRLYGQFYTEKGIPSTYRQKTEDKPDKARVFRYERIERSW